MRIIHYYNNIMDIKDTIEKLYLIAENVETKEENETLENAIKVLKHLEHLHDERVDFQGWKEKQITLGDLRKVIEQTSTVSDDAKVIVYEDDGMGYGANNGICTDIYWSEDVDGNDVIKVWF